ncbi:hypothetical protein WN943_002574 [Citrus x changshan-huyou]
MSDIEDDEHGRVLPRDGKEKKQLANRQIEATPQSGDTGAKGALPWACAGEHTPWGKHAELAPRRARSTRCVSSLSAFEEDFAKRFAFEQEMRHLNRDPI